MLLLLVLLLIGHRYDLHGLGLVDPVLRLLLLILVVVVVEAATLRTTATAMGEGLLLLLLLLMMMMIHTLLLQYIVRVELLEATAAESSLSVSGCNDFALRRY